MFVQLRNKLCFLVIKELRFTQWRSSIKRQRQITDKQTLRQKKTDTDRKGKYSVYYSHKDCIWKLRNSSLSQK